VPRVSSVDAFNTPWSVALRVADDQLTRGTRSMSCGPLNSGEVPGGDPPDCARRRPPDAPLLVDSLIDVKKYPMAFRNAPTKSTVGRAATITC